MKARQGGKRQRDDDGSDHLPPVGESPGAVEEPPPHDLETERVVLGAVLMRSELCDHVEDELDPEDFYRDAHQRIFAAMCRVHERGTVIDLRTLTDELKRKREEIGGPAYLSSLMDGLPGLDAKHVVAHARIVKEKARLRRAIETAKGLKEAAGRGDRTAADLATQAADTLYDLGGSALPGKPVTLGSLVTPGMEALEAAYARRGIVSGVATGFSEIDDLTAGMHAGDLIIIAARTSIGKTALALAIARYVGDGHKDPEETALVFSLEMSKEQLFLRMLSSESGVDSQRLRTGRLVESDWAKVANAMEALGRANILIDDTPDIGIREIRARARQVKSERKLALIVVDYIQLLRGRGKYDSRSQEVGSFSRGLKRVAREMKVPVIALAQLNRDPDKKFGGGKARRPQLTDLRESGDLENDADAVLMIWRPENKTDESGAITAISLEAEVIIAKQRNGPTGTVRIGFDPECVRFYNTERM